jgi:hypothetical protein
VLSGFGSFGKISSCGTSCARHLRFLSFNHMPLFIFKGMENKFFADFRRRPVSQGDDRMK